MKVSNNVRAIPIIDNETDLFESLWPLDDGVNYNSYVVFGSEGAAIIDTVHEAFFDVYFEELQSVVNPKDVKYIVLNHMEPDHSSSVHLLLEHIPDAKIIVSQAGYSLFNLPGNVLPVKDGEGISLGDLTLRFIHAPWVHWPETMMTYVPEEKTLFTCDLFGAYGAYQDLTADDWDFYLTEARRYFATILSRYSRFVLSALEKIPADVEIIAPGHGVVYSGKQMADIISLYKSWAENKKEGRVLILYGSMYGRTYRAVSTLVELLEAEDVDVDALDLSREDWSYAMTYVLGADVVVIAYPTYDSGIFLPLRFFLETVREKNLLNGAKIFILEFHGWGSSVQKVKALLGDLEIVDTLSLGPKDPLRISDLEALVERIKHALSIS